MENSNNQFTMMIGNNNKAILDEKKRKMTLNLDNQPSSDETSTGTATLNTPHLMNNNNINPNKRLKPAPNTLPLSTSLTQPTPTQSLMNQIETPNLFAEINTPMINRLLTELTGTDPLAITPGMSQISFPNMQHQQQQQYQSSAPPISTPKNDTDVSNALERALYDVKRAAEHNNNNNNNNFNNLNQNTYTTSNNQQQQQNTQQQYTTLTPAVNIIYMSSTTNDKLINTTSMMHPQQQQQQQQQQQTQLNGLLNKNSVKDEPQTVPVHSNGIMKGGVNNNKTGTTTAVKVTAARRTRKSSSQNNSSKMASSSISSNCSSPERSTNTPQDGQYHISPINLEEQEAIKVEKKRERNREAARKCRTRKLEKIATLQEQVKELNERNAKITNESESLRAEINALKSRLTQHKQMHGCEIPLV